MRCTALLGFLGLTAIAAEPALAAPPPASLTPGARNRVTGELCDPASVVPAHRGGDKSLAKKLNELPSGNMLLTVVREVDGCTAPVVVRQGLSGSAAAPKSKPRARPAGPPRR